jgi:hypothetical protein
MPKYRFAVRSKEGKLRTGSVTEASLEGAKERLKAAGFLIVSLTEETELVIHQAKPATGTAPPKIQRAAIIEFESTFGERLQEFLGRYVLRKEFAMVLFVLGIAWAVYLALNRPKPPPDTTPKYMPLVVQVEVDPGAFQGQTYIAKLPDIPLQFSQKASQGNRLDYSFESLKQPGRVEVSLADSSGKVVAQGDALLSLREEGVLAGSVVLLPIKKRR